MEDYLLYAIAGFGYGIYSFFKGFKVLKLKKIIENIPTSKIRSAAVGLVEIKGNPHSDKLLISPLSHKKCVYYKWVVEIYVKGDKDHGHWQKYKTGDSGNLFYVKDNTGDILVDPRGSELKIDSDFSVTNEWGKAIPVSIQKFNEENNIKRTSGFFRSTYRWTDYVLEKKDDIYVLGTAKIRHDVKNPRTNQENLIIGKERNPFYISDKKEEDVVKKLGEHIFLRIWGGGALAVVCLIFTLIQVFEVGKDVLGGLFSGLIGFGILVFSYLIYAKIFRKL